MNDILLNEKKVCFATMKNEEMFSIVSAVMIGECEVFEHGRWRKHSGSVIDLGKVYRITPPQEVSMTLAQAPIGTKAHAIGGGHWVKVESGWKWPSGAIFPRPGGDWNGKLILPEEQKGGTA